MYQKGKNMRYLLVILSLSGVVLAGETTPISEQEYNLAITKAKADYEQKIKPYQQELEKRNIEAKAKYIVMLEIELETNTKAGNLDTAIKLRDKIKELRTSQKEVQEVTKKDKFIGGYTTRWGIWNIKKSNDTYVLYSNNSQISNSVEIENDKIIFDCHSNHNKMILDFTTQLVTVIDPNKRDKIMFKIDKIKE